MTRGSLSGRGDRRAFIRGSEAARATQWRALARVARVASGEHGAGVGRVAVEGGGRVAARAAQAAAHPAVGAALRPADGRRGPGGGRHARPHARAAEHRLRLARQPARAVWALLLLCWHDAVRGAGHGEGGVDRADEPDGAADAARVPRPAGGVRGAAYLPLGLRRAAHGPTATRFPGGLHIGERDERVHVGDGRDHRGGAAEGAAGAELHGGVGAGQRALHQRAVAPRAPRRLPARRRLLLRAAAAAEAKGHPGESEARHAEKGAVAPVHQPERPGGARRHHGRLPHARPRRSHVQALRSRGAGPAAALGAAVQRRGGQQHGAVRGHGAAAGRGRGVTAGGDGAGQHRDRQSVQRGRARGRHAGDGDAGTVQHGGLAGARHAHVRRLHALRRVALQRRAHAGRRTLLGCVAPRAAPAPQHRSTTAPQHHCTTAPLHHCTTTPQHHCTTAPLHHNTTAPLHHSTTAPQHHCTTAPLHHNTTAPLHHNTTAQLSIPIKSFPGLITLLALIFLTRHFYFIPKACLSSVLICAVIFMIDFTTIIRLWRCDRRSLCVLALTAAIGLAHSVELAVLAGALADLGIVLAALSRPRVRVSLHRAGRGAGAAGARGCVARVRPALPLLYVSAERGARALLAAAARAAPGPVLLDCAALTLIDYATTTVLERVIKNLKRENQKLILYNVPSESAAALEAVPGVDARAFAADNMADALAAVEETGLADTDALLPKEHAADGRAA